MRDIDKIKADNLTVDNRRRFKGENTTSVVDNAVQGSLIEIPVCLAASTSNILLDGSVTVLDGIDLTTGGIVLVRANTDKTENGIYIPLSTGWLRWEDHRAGSLVIVLRGDVYEDTLWKNINPELDFGTTEIEYKKLPFKVSDLLDVLLTTLTTDDILKWNGDGSR